MSLAPYNATEEGQAPPAQPSDENLPLKRFRWYHKLIGLLFVILCFEMGVFLVAFPWSSYWNSNYFSQLTPEWYGLWINPYFRGAVSGLGLVNLYLSLLEVFRLQRFSEESD